MLENNKITMCLFEFLNMRDKCSEYYEIIKEIVRMCRENKNIILTKDILNTIYDNISDSSIIEHIEAVKNEREKEE